MTATRSAPGALPLWVTWAYDSGWSGWDLLLAEACRWTSLPTAAVRVASSCPECGSGAHGRPFLLAASDEQVPHVSLSRAPGIVVVALTLAGQVGVDVEPAGGVAFDGFDDVVLHPSEQAGGPVEQAVMWVRKESLLKAAGRGLAIDMRSVRLGSPRLPPRVLSWESDAHPHGVWMFDVPDVPAGYTVSVTVIGASSPTLVTRQATWADPGRPTRP